MLYKGAFVYIMVGCGLLQYIRRWKMIKGAPKSAGVVFQYGFSDEDGGCCLNVDVPPSHAVFNPFVQVSVFNFYFTTIVLLLFKYCVDLCKQFFFYFEVEDVDKCYVCHIKFDSFRENRSAMTDVYKYLWTNGGWVDVSFVQIIVLRGVRIGISILFVKQPLIFVGH